jgi:hypothetical protein
MMTVKRADPVGVVPHRSQARTDMAKTRSICAELGFPVLDARKKFANPCGVAGRVTDLEKLGLAGSPVFSCYTCARKLNQIAQ